MSRKIIFSSQFKKDLKKHYLEVVSVSWIEVLSFLIEDKDLPKKYCDHALKGDFKGYRDCHIKPDLVLIYQKSDNNLSLIRLGTHSDLF